MVYVPPPFPKIPSYRGEADPLHHVRRVVCLEKIDGTNTRIGVPRGIEAAEGLIIGGRELLESEPGYAQPFLGEAWRRDTARVRALVELSRELSRDFVLYGETCGGRIQAAGHIYGARPHFLLFAARVEDTWLSLGTSLPPLAASSTDSDTHDHEPARSLPTLEQLAERLSLVMPPRLYDGPPDRARFEALIHQPSAYAMAQGRARADLEDSQEGIVIWADPLFLAPHGEPLVAKLKHPRRRESAQIDHAGDSPEAFAESAILPERIRHAIEHLRAAGRWSGDAAVERANVAKRVIQDVARELPEYQDCLARFGKKSVRAALEQRTLALLDALADELG